MNSLSLINAESCSVQMAGSESIERWQSKIKSLKDAIAHIYETKEFADVIFTVKTRKFTGHRLILGTRSLKLAKMLLDEKTIYPDVFNVDIDNVTEEGFENLLHYLYTDELKACEDNILETYRAAKEFQQSGLLNLCRESITKWEIHSDNVCTLLKEASDVDILKERCLLYIKKNVSAVLFSDNFVKIPDDILRDLFDRNYFNGICTMTLLRTIMCWGQHQFEQQEDNTLVRGLLLQTDKPLLGQLGMEKLSNDELANVVTEYYGLLTMEELTKFFIHGKSQKATDLPDWCSSNKDDDVCEKSIEL